jgi:hypothetical protein
MPMKSGKIIVHLIYSWYTVHDLFKKFTSVKCVNFTNTSSSAGDWEGYIVQKINNRSYVISFWQENNYPYKGFTIHTEKPVFSFLQNWTTYEIEKTYCDLVYES